MTISAPILNREDPYACFDEIARLGMVARDFMLALLPPASQSALEDQVRRFLAILDGVESGFKYNVLPHAASAFSRDTMTNLNEYQEVWAGLILCTLLIQSPIRTRERQLQPLFIKNYYEQMHRIALDLMEPPTNRTVENDIFLKDLGICRLEVTPCAALLVEKYSGVPRSLAFRHGFIQMLRMIKLIILNKGRFAPYFEIHTHTPMIKAFNPGGWDRCYHFVAELLRLNPDYRGLVGGSWFYDPEVARISPHLAYLQQQPLTGGATFLQCGSTQSDVSNALVASKQRRKLYEEGKYLPTSYFMVWPRERLLEWSRQHEFNKEAL